MGATAILNRPQTPVEKSLTVEVHESQRIRREACELESRDDLRDRRIARAFTRRRVDQVRH
jgi:hypothetical protein